MRGLAVLLVATILVQAAPPASDPELAAGIALIQEGDFEAATLRLSAAIAGLASRPERKAELCRAHLYLGLARLELNQEAASLGSFRDALACDPAMRLERHEFSAQAIRVFEAARQEAGLASAPTVAVASPPPSPAPSATPPAPREKGSSRKGLLLVAGGGAAAAAIVAATAGGGSAAATSAPPTSPPEGGATSTTTPPPSSTLPPPPPTTPPTSTVPSCRYQVSGPNQSSYPAVFVGQGRCDVATQSSCEWRAETDADWINLQNDRGTGNGTITFTLDTNLELQARSERIFLREDPGASCRVSQAAAVGVQDARATALTWRSTLEVAEGALQLVLDGRAVRFQARGAGLARMASAAVPHRLEALLVRGEGAPGTWRLELAGLYRAGTLRVIAGQPLVVTPDTAVLQLAGVPGERVVLAFETE